MDNRVELAATIGKRATRPRCFPHDGLHQDRLEQLARVRPRRALSLYHISSSDGFEKQTHGPRLVA